MDPFHLRPWPVSSKPLRGGRCGVGCRGSLVAEIGYGSQEVFVTRLGQLMLEELQRRNYAPRAIRNYIEAIEDFTSYFGCSPYRLGPAHIRQYQAYLFRDRKLAASTIECRTAALMFLYVKTLRGPYSHDHIPFPKCPRPLPTVLSQDEVARLIDSAPNLMYRAMLMTMYGTGVRRAELCRLKVADIDS